MTGSNSIGPEPEKTPRSGGLEGLLEEFKPLLERFGPREHQEAVLGDTYGVITRAVANQIADRLLNPNADPTVEGGAVLLDIPSEVPAVWGEGSNILHAEGEPFMIFSEQGLGKTTLLGNYVLRRIGLVTEPLLGLPVRSSEGTCVVFAMDRPQQLKRNWARMVQKLDDDQRELLDERLKIIPGPPRINIYDGPHTLLDYVRRIRDDATMVVLDSFKDLALSLAKEEGGQAVNNNIQALVADGVETVGLHHPKKDPTNGDRGELSLDDAYGSTWLTAGHGSVLALNGVRNSGRFTAVQLKAVIKPVESVHASIDSSTGEMTVIKTGGGDELTKSILATLSVVGAVGASVKTVTVARFGPGARKSDENKVRRRLDELRKEREDITVTDAHNGPSGRVPALWFLKPRDTE